MDDNNLNADRAATLWNAQADQHNQWSELDADEKAAWIAKCAAPVGEVELPALPTQHVPMVGWTLTQAYQQGWKDAIAPYAERIRVLERELKHAKLQELVDIAQECDMGYGPSAQQPAQGIGDDPEFRKLFFAAKHASWNFDERTPELDALIAYIDCRTAGAALAGWKQVPQQYTDEQLAAGVAQYEAVADDKISAESICGAIYDGMIAAAPSPQHGKEGGNA